jgi:cytochrome c1
VGPAYISVIPKYVDRSADLVAFIRNPTKVDPAMPPMPNPGLDEIEVQSVAAYLLAELAGQTTGGKP